MPETFFIADLHLGYKNIINYGRNFDTIEEHDQCLIDLWNKTVRAQDTTDLLGDAVMNRRCLPLLKNLNGKKILVAGNHDAFKATELLECFDDVRGVAVFSAHSFVATHIPVHPQCLDRWKYNVHGHLHRDNITKPVFGIGNVINDKYICVSAEQVNYTPLALPLLLEKMK